MVNSAVRQFEEGFCRTIEKRLDAAKGVADRLEALIGLGERASGGVVGGGGRFLYELKTDPGLLGTETFRREVIKLDRVRSVGVPEQLFDGWTDKLVISRTDPVPLEWGGAHGVVRGGDRRQGSGRADPV